MPNIEQYLPWVSTSGGFTWTTDPCEPGWWLVAIHGLNNGFDNPEDPGNVGPGELSWQILAQVDAGPGLPKWRVWARKVAKAGTYKAGFPGPTSGTDIYSHLLVISGLRDAEDAADVFLVGGATGAGTSQSVSLFQPDETGTNLVFACWMNGAVCDYTTPGTLTDDGELDGAASTSRAANGTESGYGTDLFTVTSTVNAPWAALTLTGRAAPVGGVTFPQTPLQMRAEIAPGANPNIDPAFWAGLWTDITDDAQPRGGGIAITRGRQDETSTVQPSSMTVTLDNTSGKYVRLNPSSPWYGLLNKNTPARLWVNPGDGWRLRYTGFVSEWPPRSLGGEADENMPIRVDGPTRRLSRGTVLNSAVRKAIVSHGDAAGYWPLETDGSSALPGGIDMRTRGPLSFGSTGGPVGSAGALTAPFEAAAFSSVPGMPNTGVWQVSLWLDVPDGTDFSPVACWTTPGSTYTKWTASVGDPGSRDVLTIEIGQGASGTSQITNGFTPIRGVGPVLVTVRAENDGSDIFYATFINGNPDTSNSLTGDNVSPIVTAGVNSFNFAFDFTISGTISHLYVSAGDPNEDAGVYASSLGWLLDAGAGHVGERACDRIRRISSEEGVPLVVAGDDGNSELMGPQPVKTYLDLIRDCEATDGGVLYERRDGRLGYQARAGRYGATPALTLDYASGHVAPPLEPTDDDQHIVNDFTASRSNGGSARVFSQTHIDAVGQYADSNTVNVADDDQLADQAGWQVHLGTADDLRYPAVAPNLNGRPTLIPDWAGVDVGSAAAITNPGRDLPPGTVDMIVEGYTEAIDTVSWTATANCSPGKPWQVIALDDDVLGRVDTTGSALASSVALPTTQATPVVEDFEDATLNITIASGGDLGWSRTNTTAHTGGWCFRSGAITDNQTSAAIVSVPPGKTICTFWYRVSTEATFDFLHVLVDATEKFAVSGESYGWQRGAVPCSGASTITFRYVKDQFTSEGDDAAYIDDLAFITAETISVASTDDPAWTTYPYDMPVDILVGGEQMTALAVAPYATDAFGRTASSGWGTADSGQTWTALVSPPAASNYSVSGGLGRHSLSAVNQHMFTTIPSASAYFDVRADLATDKLAVGSDIILYLVGRFTNTSNYYMGNVGFSTSQAVTLTIRRNVAGTETHLGGGTIPGLLHAANTRFTVRFKGDGPLLRAKIWLAGDLEPPDWDVTVTDTSITAAGAVGMRSLITGGYTGTLPVVASYDNFSANPQTMTVTRSVNGVSKTHAVGEDVRLNTTPTLAQ